MIKYFTFPPPTKDVFVIENGRPVPKPAILGGIQPCLKGTARASDLWPAYNYTPPTKFNMSYDVGSRPYNIILACEVDYASKSKSDGLTPQGRSLQRQPNKFSPLPAQSYVDEFRYVQSVRVSAKSLSHEAYYVRVRIADVKSVQVKNRGDFNPGISNVIESHVVLQVAVCSPNSFKASIPFTGYHDNRWDKTSKYLQIPYNKRMTVTNHL